MAKGIRPFQPRFISWSKRKRGRVQRIHMKKKMKKKVLANIAATPMMVMRLRVPAGAGKPGHVVSTEVERGHHRAADEHVHVLGEKVEAELHAAELGVVAAHQLGLALGHVEGRPVGIPRKRRR